jgi:hypothetical protein
MGSAAPLGTMICRKDADPSVSERKGALTDGPGGLAAGNGGTLGEARPSGGNGATAIAGTEGAATFTREGPGTDGDTAGILGRLAGGAGGTPGVEMEGVERAGA